jgi:CheY-like chemotaxis protein
MNLDSKSQAAPMSVLVADDDEDTLSLVAETLRADGYSVTEAHDGAELLEYLRDAIDDPAARPDVIVTDVLMPKLSGLGVLGALRHARWNVPVVVMTVLADESVRTVARRLGAVGVIRKPLDVDDLRTMILNAGVAFAHARRTTRT